MRSEKSLARRAAAGDRAAFEAIFRRYHQEIYRYCRAIVRSEEDAKDAVQATMVAALRSLPGDGREISLKPWLYRVAHNEAISIVRSRQPLVDPLEAPQGSVPGADHELAERERLRRLVADLQSLPDRQRSAIVMRELSGLSFAEIGAAIETSPAAARQTLYEARESLAEMKAGRDLDCAEVRHSISDGDRRVLRGRRLRAHLRSCRNCADFRTAIGTRKADLQALCPPLPVLAASTVLASALASHGSGAVAAGGAGAGAAGAGGGAAAAAAAGGAGGAGSIAGGSGIVGGGLAASGAAKAVSLVAAVAIGAGTADATGVIHLPLLHDKKGTSALSSPPAEVRAAHHEASNQQSSAVSGDSTQKQQSAGARAGQGGARGRRGRSSDAGRLAVPGSNGRGHANGSSGGSTGRSHSSGNGRAVGHTTHGVPSTSAHSSHASASGISHSSGAAHGSPSHANPNQNSSSHSSSGSSSHSNSSSAPSGGSNAGGSQRSSAAPGHTKPPATPASPPSNGNPSHPGSGAPNGRGAGQSPR